jgi:AbrB family looped-hinge helix DNA binding protein
MNSSSTIMVKVDRRGRLVLPAQWRDELTSMPGEVLMTSTDGGS